MEKTQYSIKYKIIAWMLMMCLVITLIPDIGYGSESFGSDSENQASIEQAVEKNIVEKTENTTTYDLGEGKRETVFHGGDVRYENEDGELEDYDPSLEKIQSGEKTEQKQSLEDYAYTNVSGDKKQYMPEELSEETPVRMEYNDYAIEFALLDESIKELGAKSKHVDIEKEEVQTAYEDDAKLPVNAVYELENKKATVTYTSMDNGVKETITLAEKPESNVFKYRLKLTGMTARENPTDEGITYFDKETGDIAGSISFPWMNDATGEAYSEDITYDLAEVENKEGEYILTMTVSEDYLSDEDRQYPVTIDPTNTWQGTSEVKDSYVISGSTYGDMNFYSSDTKIMPCGKNSNGTNRTYIKFISLKGVTEGSTVTSAKFTAYETNSSSSGQTIGIYRITESWDVSTITYNTRPTCTTRYDSATTTGTQYSANVFDVTTFVKNVASGSISNYGLQLYNRTSDPGFACFYGSRSSSYKPKLVVTYYTTPDTPTGVSLSSSYVKSSTSAKVTFDSITGASTVQYKVVEYDDATATTGDTVLAYSTSRTITSGSTLPALDPGCYKIYIRGVNAGGTAGTAASAGVLHVDTTAPTFESASFKDSSGNDIAGAATAEADPVIGFSGVTDDHINSSCITYAIKSGNEEASSSDYKTPSSLTISSSKPYSGTFGLTEEDQELPSGEYILSVKVKDRAGNEAIKKFNYIRDSEEPEGSIVITDMTTGVEKSSIDKPVNLEINVDGTGSDIIESSLKLYKATVDADGNITGIDETSEVIIDENFTISENIVFDTLDICEGYGKYRLILYLKDGVGRTKEITKDFSVVYILEAPDIAEIAYSKGGTAEFTWSFPYTAQQKVKLNSIWAKFDETSEYQQLVAPGEDGTLPFEGTAQVSVPEEEGVYTVQLYGKSNDGSNGATKTISCVVDKTAPQVVLTELAQGYLRGAVADDYLNKYEVYIKEKAAEEYPETPVYTGDYALGYISEEYVSEQPLAFIDFSSEEYEPGTEYTLKLVAEDMVGNTTEVTLDVTSPEAEYMPRVILPELIIEMSERERSLPAFVVDTSKAELSLIGNVLDANWYFNNIKGTPQLINTDGTLQLDPELFYDLYVYKQEDDESRKFNVQVIENSIYKSFGADDFTIDGSSAETSMVFDYGYSMQRFKIIADESDATFQIRANTNEESGYEYQDVNVNQYYYITDLSDVSAYTNALDIKVTAGDGEDISDVGFEILADTITNDGFLYSAVETYAPLNLRVEDKINHRTYVKWDIPETLPDDVTYEIYRDTTEDFVPNNSNLVASDLKTGYYTELNVNAGKTFYYKVCAVKKTVWDEYYTEENRSTFAEVKGSRTIDQNEFLKRLGMKDFWQFTEFNTPNGNGYIEKSKGNFLYQQKDAEIPNEGFDVSLTRTYNSQSSSSGAFGFGWTHDYDMELLNICENNSTDFTHVVLKDGNGTIYHFTRDTGEEYFVSSLGSYVNLTAETAEQEKEVVIAGDETDNTLTLKYQFVLSTSDGVRYYFNSGGQLILMEDGNEKFVVFEYDADLGVLSKMTTNNNGVIEFVYNDGSGDSIMSTVKEIRLPDGSSMQYEYTKPALSVQQLLTKVTKVAADGSTISYEYEYDRGILSLHPYNLSVIKDATGDREYVIDYDYADDQVTETVYPNNEKFTFDYADDNSYTVVKKFSGGQVILGEKDYFDRVFGKCEKSIRGVDDVSVLNGTDETGLDITTYEYKDHLLTSTTTTAEYRDVDSSGYIVEKNGTKTAKASYSGDQPVKETEEDGTISEYTYYDSTAGENLAGQIKTVKETNADGKVTAYQEFKYDDALNVTETIDYIAETKVESTYYSDGTFKGELYTMKEYLLDVSSAFEVTDESLKSTSTYTYENVLTDDVATKVESCTQVIPKSDGTTESITISSTYDCMGRKVSEIDSRGYQTLNTYDGFGRCTATTYKYSDSDALKQTTSADYDANGMVTYEKLADGTEKWYTYDSMYRVTSTRVKKGDTEETISTTYGYEDIELYQGKGEDTVAVNNAYVTTQSYSDGTVISKTYEDHKGNTVRTYSGGLYTDMTYNSQGDMITKWVMGKSLSGTEGVLQLYIHDDKGNLTQTITDPDYVSGTETTGYKVREDSYDENNDLIQGSIVTKRTYDSDGNVTSTTDAENYTTTYTYDKLGNLTSVLQPDNAKYEYQYDIDGANGTTQDIVLEPRVTGTDSDRAMSKSVVTKDATDKVIRVEDFGESDADDTSISTSYEYDVRDNLIKATETNGNYKLYTYDTRDRVTAFDYYEKPGENAVKTLRTEFTYDDFDNITSMVDKEVATDGTETIYRYTVYGYDDFNRLTSVAECDVDESTVLEEIDVAANTVTYGYDIKDRMISIDYPDSQQGITGLRFNYDSSSWLQNVTAVKENGSTSLIRTYTYDNYGRTSEIIDYPDTVNSTAKWIKRVFTYDKLDRVTGIEYYDNMSGSSTDIKASYYYEYDKNGNIVSEESVNTYGDANDAPYGEEITYIYDENGRLTTEQRWERVSAVETNTAGEYYYSYDAAGNRIYEEFYMPNSVEGTQKTTENTYNEFNQLTAATVTDYVECTTATKTYAYDANGNQISETGSDGTQTLYTYDVANRLKTATGKTGETVDYIQTNKYNGYGQRVEKSETVGTATDVTNYFYDGSQILYTTDGNSDVTSFNYVGAEDNILLTVRPAEDEESDPTYYVYTKDIRESTTNVVGTDGTAVVSYSYDTFGETTEYQQDENDTFYNEICYTAGIYDKTTGLYNLSARYYDPETGVFLSQDTYRGSRSRTATLNYYAYCAGNPVSYTDPSGHAFWAIAGAAMGAYDGYQYAKKKNLKGWKKAAVIAGGAALGAVNPFKIVGKVGKVAKAVKAVKTAKKAKKTAKAIKAVTKTAKKTVVAKKAAKVAIAGNKTVKTTAVVKTQKKTVKGACFTAGTKVSTEKGFAPIEQIKPGDYVWSENPETNEKALKKVNKIFVREKDSIVRLSINGEVIETTDEHPFYVEGKGFVAASALNYGDEVRLQSGDTAVVDDIEEIQLDESIKVYNFEVEDFHTYYVSEQQVLVHNTCAADDDSVNVVTGVGYDASDRPIRIIGEWSENDMKQALLGHPPKGIGSPDIHHGGQMPGAAKHEILPCDHRNNPALHKNKYNQGVSDTMRTSDRNLHWWYRAREQGADDILPDWIYDK